MNTAAKTKETTQSIGQELAGKYLTFMLGAEEYGIEILKVQEIIRMQKITAIPRTPEFVRGVINLRGRVIPVVNLRKKFGMECCDDTEKTCIVVVQLTSHKKNVVIGIIIDEVREVRDLPAEEIEATPQFGTSVDLEFILGVAKLDMSVKVLLNIDKVLTADEIETVLSSRVEE